MAHTAFDIAGADREFVSARVLGDGDAVFGFGDQLIQSLGQLRGNLCPTGCVAIIMMRLRRRDQRARVGA